MLTNHQFAIYKEFGTGNNEKGKARKLAERLFDRAFDQGRRNQLWSRLTGKDYTLKTLSRQPKSSNAPKQTMVIPLNKIVGTESRSVDFDANFNPLKQHNRERWIGISTARRNGVVLPAVELLQNGDEYYVRDGHHRISVAKLMGQVDIDAIIVN